jgi:hypothetical protein
VTNTGTTVGTILSSGVFHSKGQGFIMTQDDEVAIYTSQVVGNLTNQGRVLSFGVNLWSKTSTGKLAFMDDMMNIFRFHADPSAAFAY